MGYNGISSQIIAYLFTLKPLSKTLYIDPLIKALIFNLFINAKEMLTSESLTGTEVESGLELIFRWHLFCLFVLFFFFKKITCHSDCFLMPQNPRVMFYYV